MKKTEKRPLIKPPQILPAIQEDEEAEFDAIKKQVLISNLIRKKNEHPILHDRVRFLQDKCLEIQSACLDIRDQLVGQKEKIARKNANQYIKDLWALSSSSINNNFLLK